MSIQVKCQDCGGTGVVMLATDIKPGQTPQDPPFPICPKCNGERYLEKLTMDDVLLLRDAANNPIPGISLPARERLGELVEDRDACADYETWAYAKHLFGEWFSPT